MSRVPVIRPEPCMLIEQSSRNTPICVTTGVLCEYANRKDD
jgi:hypothetical protein